MSYTSEPSELVMSDDELDEHMGQAGSQYRSLGSWSLMR